MVFTFDSQAQEIDSSNVYFQSLEKHVEKLNLFYSGNPKLKSSDILYVEENEYTTNNLPENINGKKVEVLDPKKLSQILKINKSIDLISIKPATWKNSKLKIEVINILVFTKGKKVYHINNGGTSYQISEFKLIDAEDVHGNYD